MRIFNKDLEESEKAVQAFAKLIANYDVPYELATTEQQRIGIDLISRNTKYEIKHMSYSDAIAIEETGECNKPGWIYTSQADKLVEVREEQEFYIFNFTEVKWFYEKTKHMYELHYNEETKGTYENWKSSFRIYPLRDFNGYLKFETVKIGAKQ